PVRCASDPEGDRRARSPSKERTRGRSRRESPSGCYQKSTAVSRAPPIGMHDSTIGDCSSSERALLRGRGHPVLVEIPLPTSTVALAPGLVVLALVALAVGELGRRSQSRDLVWLGFGGFVLALVTAVARRGEHLAVGPVTIYSFGALLSCAVL